jgi:hypothetical protein
MSGLGFGFALTGYTYFTKIINNIKLNVIFILDEMTRLMDRLYIKVVENCTNLNILYRFINRVIFNRDIFKLNVISFSSVANLEENTNSNLDNMVYIFNIFIFVLVCMVALRSLYKNRYFI